MFRGVPDLRDELRIAPAALQVEFARLKPGHESEDFKKPDDKVTRSYCVFGEWDLLRLTLVDALFPPAESGSLISNQTSPVRNHHAFQAYLWTTENAAPASTNGASAESKVLDLLDMRGAKHTRFLVAPDAPALFICMKLDPRWTHRWGIHAEMLVVSAIRAEVKRRKWSFLSGGSIGWQELVFLVHGPSLGALRSVIRWIYGLTARDVFGEAIEEDLADHALAARTVSYPCAPAAAYHDPVARSRLTESSFKARLLLDLRPGVAIPPYLATSRTEAELQEISDPGVHGLGGQAREPLVEQFGDYDLAISPPAGKTTLARLLRLVAKIRSSSGDHAQESGWLLGTSIVLDFELPEESWKRGAVFKPVLDRERSQYIDSLTTWLEELSSREDLYRGLHPLQRSRMAALLNRVVSDLPDPILSESVTPLAHFLFRFRQDWNDDLRAAEGKRNTRFSTHAEPYQLDLILTLMEFALGQRTEGLQQFLFNALPTSYYGRGGINRLLAATDAALQEAWLVIGKDNPGFVVFGVPNRMRFACTRAIVMAPIPAMFDPAWWWILYHEAANGFTALYFPDVSREVSKLIPDIVTLALPFSYDLGRFTKGHALGLTAISNNQLSWVDSSYRVGTRIAFLHLLSGLWKKPEVEALVNAWLQHPGVPDESRLEALLDSAGESWKNFLEDFREQLQKQGSLREAQPDVHQALANFYDLCYECLPMSRKSWLVERAPFLGKVEERLSGVCLAIEKAWVPARLQKSPDGNGTPVPLAHLIDSLLRRRSKTPFSASSLPHSKPGAVPSGEETMADLIYRAFQNLESLPLGEATLGVGHQRCSVQQSLSEFLTAWDLAACRLQRQESDSDD